MFYVESSDIENGVYNICDTSDGVTEAYTYTQVHSALKNRITILGVTLKSLELGIKPTVILRLGSCEYDGFILCEVRCGLNVYSYQIINRDMVDVSVEDLVACLRHINGRPDISLEADKDDTLQVYNYRGMYDGIIEVEHNGSFCSLTPLDIIAYNYMYNAKFRGISSISWDGVMVDGVFIDIWGTFKSLFADEGVAYKSFSSQDFEFYATMQSLNDQIPAGSHITMGDKVPLYNLCDNIRSSGKDKVGNTFPLLMPEDEPEVGFDTEHCAILFNDKPVALGLFNSSYEYISGRYNWGSRIISNVQSVIAKESLMRKKKLVISQEYYNDLDFGDNLSKFTSRDTNLVKTPFGYMSIDYLVKFLNSKTCNVFLSRFTHIGNLVINPNTMNLDIIKATAYCHRFSDYLGDMRSLIYHNEALVPFGVSSISVDENGVDIQVGCVVRSDVDEDWDSGYGYGFVEIPLIFINAPVYDLGDFYSIKLGMQVLTLEKGLFNSLVGNYNNDLYLDTCFLYVPSSITSKKNIAKVISNIRYVNKVAFSSG